MWRRKTEDRIANQKERISELELKVQQLSCEHPINEREIYVEYILKPVPRKKLVERCDKCWKIFKEMPIEEHKLRLAELRFKQWSALKDESAGNSE